jgi:hypothetical protein
MESRFAPPLARNKGLVVEELGDELLVYDLDVKHAHCLTPLAARVWRECDGKKRPEAIAAQLGLDVAEVAHAVDELRRCDLLATLKAKKNGMSRRDFGLKVTKVAAATATLPLILSIAAPAVAATDSQEIFCLSTTPDGGTNACSVCNNAGGPGANSLCCCCHDTTLSPGGNTVAPGLKGCAADAAQCCCSGPNDWGGSRCTEPQGQNLCPDFIAAGGCS